MKSKFMKNFVKIVICMFFLLAFSSCGMQKNVAISTTGGKTNVSGGVIHPATREPVMIDLQSSDNNKR